MINLAIAIIGILVLFAQIKLFTIASELVKIRKLLERGAPKPHKISGVRTR